MGGMQPGAMNIDQRISAVSARCDENSRRLDGFREDYKKLCKTLQDFERQCQERFGNLEAQVTLVANQLVTVRSVSGRPAEPAAPVSLSITEATDALSNLTSMTLKRGDLVRSLASWKLIIRGEGSGAVHTVTPLGKAAGFFEFPVKNHLAIRESSLDTLALMYTNAAEFAAFLTGVKV